MNINKLLILTFLYDFVKSNLQCWNIPLFILPERNFHKKKENNYFKTERQYV